MHRSLPKLVATGQLFFSCVGAAWHLGQRPLPGSGRLKRTPGPRIFGEDEIRPNGSLADLSTPLFVASFGVDRVTSFEVINGFGIVRKLPCAEGQEVVWMLDLAEALMYHWGTMGAAILRMGIA